jgi:hypothetical protein
MRVERRARGKEGGRRRVRSEGHYHSTILPLADPPWLLQHMHHHSTSDLTGTDNNNPDIQRHTV